MNESTMRNEAAGEVAGEVTRRQIPMSGMIRMKDDPPADDGAAKVRKRQNNKKALGELQSIMNLEGKKGKKRKERRSSCILTSRGVATPIRQRKRKKKKWRK